MLFLDDFPTDTALSLVTAQNKRRWAGWICPAASWLGEWRVMSSCLRYLQSPNCFPSFIPDVSMVFYLLQDLDKLKFAKDSIRERQRSIIIHNGYFIGIY